jgi:hypothetical protein
MAGRVDATGGAESSADHFSFYEKSNRLGAGYGGRVFKATTTAAAAAVGLPAGMEVAFKVPYDSKIMEREIVMLRKVSCC